MSRIKSQLLDYISNLERRVAELQEHGDERANAGRGDASQLGMRIGEEDTLRASEFRLAEAQEIADVGNWDMYIDRHHPDKVL